MDVENSQEDDDDFTNDQNLYVGQNVIEHLPELLMNLLQKMGHAEHDINEKLQGEQVHIMNIERDEDLLIYLCQLGERIVFGRKLQERIDNVCAPK